MEKVFLLWQKLVTEKEVNEASFFFFWAILNKTRFLL